MSAVERAAAIIRDTVNAYGIASELAAAGLLVTDADRAVLDAAEAWYRHACAATRTGHPTVDDLIAAVRARREAQEVAEQDAYNQAIQWDPTNGGARREAQ